MVKTQLGMIVEPGYSVWVAGLFVFAAVALSWILVLFVSGGRYSVPSGPLAPAELDEARREVGRRFSDLAPRMMLLLEKMRTVDEALESRGLEEERWRKIERISREAPAAGACRKYSVASALADAQPLESLKELRHVPWMVETAISKFEEAEKLCYAEERA